MVRTGRNRSPRWTSRGRKSRMVNRSGERLGSSSSSQSIGAETGAPGAGAWAVGRHESLVDGVLGVVEPSQPAAFVHLPLPADQVRHDGADCPGQALGPGPGLLETRAPGRWDPDLDPPATGYLRLGPQRPDARAPCGGAGPAPAGHSRPWRPRDRCRSGRRPAMGLVDEARSRRATPGRPKLAAHTSAAASSTTRDVRVSPRPASGLSQRGSQSGAWPGNSLCQKPPEPAPFGKRCMFRARPAQVRHQGRGPSGAE